MTKNQKRVLAALAGYRQAGVSARQLADKLDQGRRAFSRRWTPERTRKALYALERQKMVTRSGAEPQLWAPTAAGEAAAAAQSS